MNQPLVYEAVARYLAARCTDTVFALMGEGNMRLIHSLASCSGMSLVHGRHENAVVAMADGYARVTGRPGIATVTTGPGVTQIATALVAAARGHNPVVVITSEFPNDGFYHLQGYDPSQLAAAGESDFVRIEDGDRCLDLLAAAVGRAHGTRRPVVVSVPASIQDREYPWDLADAPSYEYFAAATTDYTAAGESLDWAAQLLSTAKRPVVLAGSGAVDAAADLVAIADRVGAVLATTLKAKGLFHGHPFDAGIAGAFAWPYSRSLFASADAVLAVGASLGHYTLEGGFLFRDAQIVHADLAPTIMRDGFRASHIQLAGDARAVLTTLHKVVDASTDSQLRTPQTAEALARQHDAYRGEYDTESPGRADGLDPRPILDQVNELPQHVRLVVGAGHFWNITVDHLTRHDPRLLYQTIEFGAIGHGVPSAIGAAVADHTPTVAVEGDGSLLMNIQELDTMARSSAPVLVVVMNDGAYGAEVHKMASLNLDPTLAAFTRVDFAAAAASMAVEGHTLTAESAAKLPQLLESFAADPRPMLVDVHTSPSMLARSYRRLYRGEHDL